MLKKQVAVILSVCLAVCLPLSCLQGWQTAAFAAEEGSEAVAQEPWVGTVLVEVDYENRSAGDIIYNGSYYNITVQQDPTNPDNLCSMEIAAEHETQGFGPSYILNPNETGANAFVIEEDVMFGSAEYMEYQMYARSVDGENGNGYGANMWSAYSNSILGITPELNRWYTLRCMVDCINGRYSVYMLDDTGNFLYQKRDIELPAGIDYTKGFKELYTRYQGTINTDAKVYTDNLRVFTTDSVVYAEAIAQQYEEAMSNVELYSDAAAAKIQDAMVLYVDGPYAYVDNERMMVDEENPSVVPIIRNDRTLVPVRFVSENFDAKVKWNAAQNRVDIVSGDTEIQMYIGDNTMYVNGQPVQLDMPPVLENDRTLIPLRAMAESIGKYVFWDDNGLIVISDTENLFDTNTEQALIDELVQAKYAVKRPEIHLDDTALLEETGEREYEFSNRNSPENVQALAEELASMLDLSRSEFQTFCKHLDAGAYNQALKEFRNLFLDGVLELEEAYFDTSFQYSTLLDAARTKVADIKADMMLYDVISANGKNVSLGAPGVVNWDYENPEKKFDSSYFFASPFMWHYTTFDPLLYTYMATDNIAYFVKWMEYMDDFCLNQNIYTDIMPYDVPDGVTGSQTTKDFIYRMKTLSAYLDGNYDVFSETSFARLVLKIVNDYPVQSIVYTRNNPQNWTHDQYNDIMTTGLMLDELGFKWGEQIYRSGLRRCESFPTITFLPDGTDIEQVVAYDIVGLRGLGWITDTMQTIAPDMLSDEWYGEIEDYALGRGTFLTHILTPQGNFPMGFRSDTRSRLYTIDEMRGYFDDIFQINENQVVASTLLGEDIDERPSYTSEAFPYGGFYLFREGWDLESQNGMLFGHSNYTINNMGKNVFVLNAFNQDLVAAGEVGMYDHVVTQNFVDGVPQFDTAGIPTWGHKGLRISAWDEPNDSRWISSEQFDMAESVYNGPYGSGLVPTGEIEKYGGQQNITELDAQVYAGQNVIEGVIHQRLVSFLREHGLWIVTDRLSSEDEHTYTTRWTFPIEEVVMRIRDSYRAFKKENIEISQSEGWLKTQDEGMPNISLYNFSTSPIKYKTSTEEVPETNGEKTSDFFFLDVDFEGQDDQILISVFYPRQTIGDELISVKDLGDSSRGIAGFEAVLGDGTKAKYVVAADKDEELTLDTISMRGESLLLMEKYTGEVYGMALGCQGISVDGAVQQVAYTDFEFKVTENGLTDLKPLYTPVKEVDISPEIDAFYDEIEITMSCETEDVDIRYTTDETEPTLESPLYTGPIALDETTIVKAKAFRKGVTQEPVNMTGTEASVTVRAVFTKEEMRPAVETGELESGLYYDYYQGDWKKEFMALNDCTPVSSGTVDAVFDISPKQTEDGTFSFRYTGYNNIPEDGVYTFHAPDEYNKSECMAGYELNLYIDGEQWYPATRSFAFGSWSLPLEAGMHTFEVGYTDFRKNAVEEYNRDGLKRQLIWDGVTPELMISGPGIEKQLIPDNMLYRDKQ